MRAEGNLRPVPPAPAAIELRHLRAFVAVAEELSFGRAAERLYISQPALSRQIRALEQFVGCELLRRSTHRVALTDAGHALLGPAREVLADLDAAIATTQSVGGELPERAARMLGPFVDDATGTDLSAIRASFEQLHAQFEPPPETTVASVVAGGVAGLTLRAGDDMDAPITLLYLHGGGYVMGSAYGHRHIAGALAVAAAAPVLVPDYRLAPEHPFPAAVEDAVRAYCWLLDAGTDPQAVVVVGDSAGAGLVHSLLMSLRRDELPAPGGAIMCSPWLDLTDANLPSGLDPAESAAVRESNARSRTAYLAGHPPDDPLLDPFTADLSAYPALLIQAARGEYVCDTAQRLAAHAHAQGVDVRLDLYPSDTHGFQAFWSFLPEAAEAVEAAGRFAQERRLVAASG